MLFLERLDQCWRENRLLSSQPPITTEEIEAFGRQHSVLLPEEISHYFQKLNGMSTRCGHDVDANGFSFLPLKRVKSVRKFAAEMCWEIESGILGEDSAFVFIDYLQWCGAYAFETVMPNRGSIYLLGSARPRLIADSLSAFVDLYLADDPKIYGM